MNGTGIISLLRGRDFLLPSFFDFRPEEWECAWVFLGSICGCKEKGACLNDKPTLRVI